MAQGIQRDPLSIASGGLPGLFGTTFSPIPATEGDIAARSRAIVPQFGGAPAQILSTSTFRPTAQAVLPTPLLRRPEEVGRAAFRRIREEAQFPALKPAETIEEIDNRLRSILPVIEQAPPQQPEPGGSGSILEPPTPPPPPSFALEAVATVTPPPPQLMPEEAMPVAPVTAPLEEQPPATPTTLSPVEPTPAPPTPTITLIVPPRQAPPPPPPPLPYSSLLQILFGRSYQGGYEGPATYASPSGSTGSYATGSFGSTGSTTGTTPSFEVGERFGDWGFDARYV
jgi:hypothetical protein